MVEEKQKDEWEERLNEIKEKFMKEFSKITTIDELKELYALHLAKREQIIEELRKQNDIILKTAFKNQNKN